MSNKLEFTKISTEEAMEFIAKGMFDFLYARGVDDNTLYAVKDTEIDIKESVGCDWYVLEEESLEPIDFKLSGMDQIFRASGSRDVRITY